MKLLSVLIMIYLAIFPVSVAAGTVAVDMRHGLSESRIRALRPLADGRLIIATAGFVDVFDGTSFVNMPIEASNGIKLAAKSKNRYIYYDRRGRIWLKTPASRYNETGSVHVFDPRTASDITEDVFAEMPVKDIVDLFIDELGRCWVIDSAGMLFTPDAPDIPKINLAHISNDLPVAISVAGNSLFLCFDSGKICALNISDGLIRYAGAPNMPSGEMRLTNGIKWRGDKLMAAFQRHNRRDNSWIASLDTADWKWTLDTVGALIYDFEVDSAGNLVKDIPSLGLDIFCMAYDRNGALWVGTKENGLRYIKEGRDSIIRCSQTAFTRQPKTATPRERQVFVRYASGITNSFATDSANRYIYLATTKGLMIVDSLDRHVATVAANVALPKHNIQSVAVDRRGDVWFASTSGISRLRPCGNDTFDIIHFGILDGLDIGGAEFYPAAIEIDSCGYVTAGYPGGSCRLDTAAIDERNYKVYRIPEPKEADVISGSSRLLWPAFLSVVVLIGLLAVTLRYRKRQAETTPAAEPPYQGMVDRIAEKELGTADENFVKRLNAVISEHLGDEDLNVVTLSSYMAMDRTNLYRRMQAAMGVSPSVYIRRLRLEAAADLLCRTELHIADIAISTGFSSAKYFSSTFKEACGMLPAQYRKLNSKAQGG